MMNHSQGVGHTFLNLKLTRNLLAGALALALCLALGSARANAQTTDVWIANSGTFNVPANWDTAQVPQGGDTLHFTNEENFTVSLSANTATLEDTVISNHTGAVTINASGFTWALTNVFRIG